MKKALLTFGIFAAITCTVIAQQTTHNRDIFRRQISTLVGAMTSKNLTAQNTGITNLLISMNNQIAYLNSSAQAKQNAQAISTDTQIRDYVKNLPTDKIVVDQTALINQLNQFAATITN